MSYNLQLFSNKIKMLRTSLGYTQSKISEITGISERTIIRMEKGESVPDLITLELLSPLYKVDLIDLLSQCRVDDYSRLETLKRQIEYKLESNDYKSIDKSIEQLKLLLENFENKYLASQIKQYILFVEGMKKDNSKEFDGAIKNFCEVLSIEDLKTDLLENSNHLFSEIELRAILNMAFTFEQKGEREFYKELLFFCFDNSNESYEIYTKVLFNVGGYYLKINDYKKALKIFNKCLFVSRKKMDYIMMPYIYYSIGACNYRLGINNYEFYFKTSITLFESYGLFLLKDKIIDKIEKQFGLKFEK